MNEKDLNEVFRDAMLSSLEETFENVQGMYLDQARCGTRRIRAYHAQCVSSGRNQTSTVHD